MAGAEVAPLCRAWNAGAAKVLGRVRSIGADAGPVLETPARQAVEFIVAPGTAASWPQMIGTRAASDGIMRCPPPHVTLASGLRSTGARCWIVPPDYAPATTDADALCEAVAAALLTRATAVLAAAGRGERR